MHERAPEPSADAMAVLETCGLVFREGATLRPTRRFRGAMARAAVRLMACGDSGHDLRVPIAAALVDVLGEEVTDAEIARYVVAMLPIQAGELPGHRR